MGRLLDSGRAAIRGALSRVGRGWSHVQERRPLDSDLLESDDAYLVVFDAPGVRGDDVEVRFAEPLHGHLDGAVREPRAEFETVFPGRGTTLSGSADLPADADVNPDGAAATLKRSGTLQVEIPKTGAADEVPVTESDDED